MKKLSIIIVTRNAGSDLELTLKSIFSQVFNDYEIVIIDGKSTDGTLNLIATQAEKIAYFVSEKDKGIYDAMNKGIKASKGEYIQFLNAGDYFTNNKVLEQVFLNLQEQPTLIYGDINILHTDGKITRQVAGEYTLENLLARGTGVLCHQAMFVRRDIAPIYNLRYKYKSELNWYFDLVELEGFSYKKQDTIVVNYALGGWGHQNFIRNRLDWLKVVYQRYGMSKMRESKIVPFLLKNSTYRYPWLGKADRALYGLKMKYKNKFKK